MNKIMGVVLAWMRKLFRKQDGIPAPVNRKERRARQSIARQTRLHEAVRSAGDDDER